MNNNPFQSQIDHQNSLTNRMNSMNKYEISSHSTSLLSSNGLDDMIDDSEFEEPNNHPYYPRLNIKQHQFKPIHWLAPILSLPIYLLYIFYFIPYFELTSPLCEKMKIINTTLLVIFLSIYIILLTKKPSTIVVDATSEERASAIKRAEHAHSQDCHCYDIDSKIRYCYHCKKFVSIRTFHCAECNCCVDMKDHHCDFFGFCIGKHNLMLFYLFFISLFILSISAFFTYIILFFHINYRIITIVRVFKFVLLLNLSVTFFFGMVVAVYFMKMAITFAKKGITQFEEYVDRKVSLHNPQIRIRRLNIFERLTVLLGINNNFC